MSSTPVRDALEAAQDAAAIQRATRRDYEMTTPMRAYARGLQVVDLVSASGRLFGGGCSTALCQGGW
jgi:hypothetical protein